ncbi:hypothetical protein PVAP13_4KG097433 [Panicum virgatum]|uniref:Uncharacterized protein n=1 Tax=Panicum virgatum TaxID=38727 RepID=A0A8T0TMP1_PANVG|nr:hypothetical protein PVAP13_4KG097433 [Panicum virgatum]
MPQLRVDGFLIPHFANRHRAANYYTTRVNPPSESPLPTAPPSPPCRGASLQLISSASTQARSEASTAASPAAAAATRPPRPGLPAVTPRSRSPRHGGGGGAELGQGREGGRRQGREGGGGRQAGFKKWGRGAALRGGGWWGGLALCRGGRGRGGRPVVKKKEKTGAAAAGPGRRLPPARPHADGDGGWRAWAGRGGAGTRAGARWVAWRRDRDGDGDGCGVVPGAGAGVSGPCRAEEGADGDGAFRRFAPALGRATWRRGARTGGGGEVAVAVARGKSRTPHRRHDERVTVRGGGRELRGACSSGARNGRGGRGRPVERGRLVPVSSVCLAGFQLSGGDVSGLPERD